jgi:hypothetical protein
MRVLLFDSEGCLDNDLLGRVAAAACLTPLSVEWPLEASALSGRLRGDGEADLLLTCGAFSPSPAQAQELDAVLEALGGPLDLVLDVAADPRPLEQRLVEPLAGDSPAAAHYRQLGLLRRIHSDEDTRATAAAVAFVLADARRAGSPQREVDFPPPLAPRAGPEPAPEAQVGDVAAAPAPGPAAEPGAASQEGVPAWRRSAEQKGRIKRRPVTRGGRDAKGWKPKS